MGFGLFATVLLAVMMLGVSNLVSATTGPNLTSPSTSYKVPWNTSQSLPDPTTFPIQHVVVVVQENHAFDNFYGTYCSAVSHLCPYAVSGIPAGTCVPKNVTNPSAGCVRPFPFTNGSSASLDMSHSWTTSHEAWNNGSMNGFYAAEKTGSQPFGYYNGTVIPYYWDLAQEYGLGDSFFSGSLSYSLPNHWQLIAATSPYAGEHSFLQSAKNQPLTKVQTNYLNQSNATPTLGGLLLNSSVSWKYYDNLLPTSYQSAVSMHAANGVFSFWNPFAAKADTYNASTLRHFVSRASFLTDAANGTLPNVSWVIPTMAYSDHPPQNVTLGQEWVSTVVNAVESSPEWKSTAIFVTWDEYGGFYDHVAPPQISGYGLGFRVPLVVISPYTPEGYVSNQTEYLESIVHFIEWRWQLGSLATADRQALVPIEYFDTAAHPRKPFTMTNITLGLTYPAKFQAEPTPNAPRQLQAAPGPGSGQVSLTWKRPLGGAPVTFYRLNYGPVQHPTLFTVRLDGYSTSAVIANLTSGQKYSFSLRAVDPQGFSAAVNSTTAALAPAPWALSAQEIVSMAGESSATGSSGAITFSVLALETVPKGED